MRLVRERRSALWRFARIGLPLVGVRQLKQVRLAVGVTAWATGYLASAYGLRPEPFYLGVVYAVLGLLVSVFLVRDTDEHVRQEMQSHPPEPRVL